MNQIKTRIGSHEEVGKGIGVEAAVALQIPRDLMDHLVKDISDRRA